MEVDGLGGDWRGSRDLQGTDHQGEAAGVPLHPAPHEVPRTLGPRAVRTPSCSAREQWAPGRGGPGPRRAPGQVGPGPKGMQPQPLLLLPCPSRCREQGVPNSMVLTLASRSERPGATGQLRAELSLDARPAQPPGPFPDAVEPWLLPRCVKLARRALRPASRWLVQGRALIPAPCGPACVPAAAKQTTTSVLLKQPISASWSCWDPTSCQGWFLPRLQGTPSLVPGPLSWLSSPATVPSLRPGDSSSRADP